MIKLITFLLFTLISPFANSEVPTDYQETKRKYKETKAYFEGEVKKRKLAQIRDGVGSLAIWGAGHMIGADFKDEVISKIYESSDKNMFPQQLISKIEAYKIKENEFGLIQERLQKTVANVTGVPTEDQAKVIRELESQLDDMKKELKGLRGKAFRELSIEISSTNVGINRRSIKYYFPRGLKILAGAGLIYTIADINDLRVTGQGIDIENMDHYYFDPRKNPREQIRSRYGEDVWRDISDCDAIDLTNTDTTRLGKTLCRLFADTDIDDQVRRDNDQFYNDVDQEAMIEIGAIDN